MLSVHVVKGFAMSAFPRSISLLEYQAMDAASEVKSEYFRGEVFAMAGGTPEHSLICANFIGESRAALKGKPCVVYTSDLRIKVDRTGLYTYPDSAIICGELLRDELVSNTALNPTVIVEVLSESTETYDRGRKSSHYRQIESLQELVLISQDRVSVECYVRKPHGHWLLRESLQLDDRLLLESVGIEIALREIYRGTVFSS
jgi:Uma2 family endonuclease